MITKTTKAEIIRILNQSSRRLREIGNNTRDADLVRRINNIIKKLNK